MQYCKDGSHLEDPPHRPPPFPAPYHHDGYEATDENTLEHTQNTSESFHESSKRMASGKRKLDSVNMNLSEDTEKDPELSVASPVASGPSSSRMSDGLHAFPNPPHPSSEQAVNSPQYNQAYFLSHHSHHNAPYATPRNFHEHGSPRDSNSVKYQSPHGYNSYAYGSQQERASASMTSELPLTNNPHSDASNMRYDNYASNDMYYPSGPFQPLGQVYGDGVARPTHPPHQQYYDRATENTNSGADAPFFERQSQQPYTPSQPNNHSNSYGRSHHDYPYMRHDQPGPFMPQPPPPSAAPRANYATGSYSRTGHQTSIVSQHPQFPPTPLTMPDDVSWLSEFLCFVRLHCVEVFCADSEDVASRMNSKKVSLGQAGIRCRFCAHLTHRRRARRSSTFPSSLCRIYQSITMMLRDHFIACTAMPQETKQRYKTLKSNASQGIVGSKQYWIDSARRKGLIDTPHGIFFADRQSFE